MPCVPQSIHTISITLGEVMELLWVFHTTSILEEIAFQSRIFGVVSLCFARSHDKFSCQKREVLAMDDREKLMAGVTCLAGLLALVGWYGPAAIVAVVVAVVFFLDHNTA